MTFYVDDATIDINRDGCQFAFRKQFAKDFKIDIPEILSCLDFIGWILIKYKVIFNKFKNPVAFCMLKQQKKTRIWTLDSWH